MTAADSAARPRGQGREAGLAERARRVIAAETPIVHDAHRRAHRCMGCVVMAIAAALELQSAAADAGQGEGE